MFDAERAIQPYRRYPLASIQRLGAPGAALFDVVFNYTDFHVLNEVGRLSKTEPLHWWFSDRHSFPLLVEITRSPRDGSRMVKVSAGAGSDLTGLESELGNHVLRALEAIAADPRARPDQPCGEGKGWS